MQHTCDDNCDVKLRLLQAAKKLFAKQGFDATSVRQICEEAGANVALVSYHFGGKEQLFKAIYDRYIQEERFKEFEPLMGNPAEALKAFIRALIHYRFNEPDMVAITFREISAESSKTTVLQEYLHPVWRLLRHILESGMEKGQFRIDSVDYTMTAVMAMLMFPPSPEFVRPVLEQPLEREKMLRHVTELVFRVVGTAQLNE